MMTMLRHGVVLLLVVIVVSGPVYRQALGGDIRLIRSWTMFSGVAYGIYDVQLFFPDNGQNRPIRIKNQAGRIYPGKRPAVRLNSKRKLIKLKNDICHKFGNVEIFAITRLATRKSGWETVDNGNDSICHSNNG